MYKNTSQHRRSVHFQKMVAVRRALREISAIDAAGAARALRVSLDKALRHTAPVGRRKLDPSLKPPPPLFSVSNFFYCAKRM